MAYDDMAWGIDEITTSIISELSKHMVVGNTYTTQILNTEKRFSTSSTEQDWLICSFETGLSGTVQITATITCGSAQKATLRVTDGLGAVLADVNLGVINKYEDKVVQIPVNKYVARYNVNIHDKGKGTTAVSCNNVTVSYDIVTTPITDYIIKVD